MFHEPKIQNFNQSRRIAWNLADRKRYIIYIIIISQTELKTRLVLLIYIH
jgi:hypothetical protein